MVGVAEFLDFDKPCRNIIDLAYEICGIEFILIHMALLVKYSRVRLHWHRFPLNSFFNKFIVVMIF